MESTLFIVIFGIVETSLALFSLKALMDEFSDEEIAQNRHNILKQKK
jgi:hypothetical protein